MRWMHRNDVQADMPTVWTMADAKIAERMMRDSASMPTTEIAPRLWLHAGLVYLHELAHDDDGLMREAALFDQAVQDEAFRWSIDNVTPDMFAREMQ